MTLTMRSSNHFLALPQEIRDMIYLLTLEQRFDRPTRTLRTIAPPGTDGQLYLWSEQSTWRYLNLLAVNRQVRSEAQDFVEQLGKSGRMRFTLDILAKGYIYTPKWTQLTLGLQPCSPLDLTVNLRILSTEAFRRNDGWPRQPGCVFRALVNFLSRFIFKGPSFLDHDPTYETPGPHYINKLSVLVSFQDDYTRGTHADTVHEIFRMMKALSMLETANHYLGKLHVHAEWTVRGEDFQREREWNLIDGIERQQEMLKEEDWAALGFYFGETWVKKYARGSRSGSSTPSLSRSF